MLPMGEPVRWKKNEFGQYEGFDRSGKLVAAASPKGRHKKAIEEGTMAPLSKAREVIDESKSGKGYPFAQKKANVIIALVSEGFTLSKICREIEEIPPRHAVNRWLVKYPEFKAQYEEAKKLRADVYADKVIDEAEDATDEKKISVHKFKAEQFRWAAGVGDPSEFNPRPKEEHQASIYVINTGIERPAIDVEGKPVKDAKG